MVLSLPFPGEQGYRLYTTGDFYFYIWKANQGPAHNNPPLPLLTLLLHDWAESHTLTHKQRQMLHTSPHFRAPSPYLRLCDIQYVSDIKTQPYADEMKGTISQTQ